MSWRYAAHAQRSDSLGRAALPTGLYPAAISCRDPLAFSKSPRNSTLLRGRETQTEVSRPIRRQEVMRTLGVRKRCPLARKFLRRFEHGARCVPRQHEQLPTHPLDLQARSGQRALDLDVLLIGIGGNATVIDGTGEDTVSARAKVLKRRRVRWHCRLGDQLFGRDELMAREVVELDGLHGAARIGGEGDERDVLPDEVNAHVRG